MVVGLKVVSALCYFAKHLRVKSVKKTCFHFCIALKEWEERRRRSRGSKRERVEIDSGKAEGDKEEAGEGVQERERAER